jgi:hypothetical protein
MYDLSVPPPCFVGVHHWPRHPGCGSILPCAAETRVGTASNDGTARVCDAASGREGAPPQVK